MVTINNGFLVGEIKLWASGPPVPDGFLAANGDAISRTTYSVLFNLIGTTFGVGDGSTTFNLPDFRGRFALGSGNGPGLTARSVGQQVGTETHQLSESEIPSHTHTYINAAVSGGQIGTAVPSGGTGAIQNTGSTGGNGAHNNMPPSTAILFIIKY